MATDPNPSGAHTDVAVAVAVVGMAARFPGARNVEQLWENLCAGREGVTFFAPHELDPSIPPAVRNDAAYVRAKGVIEDCDKFDAEFFGMSPLEAQVMDPQQRIALELSWGALEDAGHIADRQDRLVGVYVGMNWNRYRSHVLAARPDVVARFGEFNTALANEYDFLATRISYKLNLRGPSVTVSSACSTSLVAIAQASQALLNYECDVALAGGVSVSVPVNSGYLHMEGGMLSKDGHCRTFDASSSGTTFNDGAGMVVLRRLQDAIDDGDHIYAVVRGFAVNNDGAEKVSFTAPSVEGQIDVVRAALEHADVDPATVGYIEAHGTGTPLGDPIEIAALKSVFADAHRQGARCAIGSIKSSVGHLVHAAGVAGFIKAVLATHQGQIPPSLFFEKANPRLGLDDSPFYVNTATIPWPTSVHPRRAGVSAFGVGGTNAHVIVEQYAPTPSRVAGPSPQIVCLSAKTPEALAAHSVSMQEHLRRHVQDLSLADVAHTLQEGRVAMRHRVAFVAASTADAVTGFGDTRRQIRGSHAGTAELAFMFTGQGSQRAGMGRWLHENDATFRAHFDRGAAVLNARTGLDLKELMLRATGAPEVDVEQTVFAQPAIFLFEYSLAKALEPFGISPSAFVGHSVGEFVAAVLAGVFSFDDALYLVARRGEAMQRMPSGSMIAVYCREAEARELLEGAIDIAAVNADELCVLSGPNQSIDKLVARLDSGGRKYKRLRTSHAFHSAMMDPAVEAFSQILAGVSLSPPQKTIISTVTGQELTVAEAVDKGYWAAQLRSTVRFARALDALADRGRFVLLEVGPGAALTTLALQHRRSAEWSARAVMPGAGIGDQSATELLEAVAACWAGGVRVDWRARPREVPVRTVSLPTYAFARKRCWVDPADVPGQADAPRPSAQALPVATEGRARSEPTQETPFAMDGRTMNDSARTQSVEQRVIRVLEDTSGYDLANADKNASFSELGFDSLLLTQVSTALKQEFGVDVSFRVLMEECTSLAELVTHLAPLVRVESVATAAETAVDAVRVGAPAAPMALPQFVTGEVSSDVRGLIEKQLAIMQLQLQALAAAPLGAAAPQASTSNAAPSASLPKAPQPASDAEPAPKKHTPGTRIERNKQTSKQLTRSQQAFVDKLTTNYTAATAASKRFAQAHRKHLADPRTVSGFNPLWKEMVYPIVTNRSKGSKIWDLDGREYIDLTNGFGPIFFGHSPDFVTQAVIKQIESGIETGPQSSLAGEVAELFCEITGNERIAYANTGSEAVLAALRLARTVTGRNKVVIFEGGYHGIFDEVVVRPGKNGAGLPAAPGIPRDMTANIVVLPYGTAKSLEQIKGMAGELAAVMVEPVQSRHPDLQPFEFLRSVREITAASGTAFIFDEVVTGFRVHPGGAQALLGIRADMAVYGKVVAGGYPIGLIGGKARFLDALDGGFWQFGDDSIPEVGVTFFAGTFVRHPVALAATKAVLEKLKADGPEPHLNLAKTTAEMTRELKSFVSEVDAAISIEQFSSYFYFSIKGDEPYGSLLFYLLRLGGIHTWEYRPCFLTLSHSQQDIQAFKRVFVESVSEMIRHGLLHGDAVAVERIHKGKAQPPVEGARLGKDKDGIPAWFVPDPERPGKFIQVGNRKTS